MCEAGRTAMALERIEFPGPWDELLDLEEHILELEADAPQEKWRALYASFQEFHEVMLWYIRMAEAGT